MFDRNNGELFNVVKLKRHELLNVLEENLEKHQVDVEDALSLRRNEMIDYFSNQLEKMNKDASYNPRESVNFPKPVDSSEDYKKAIRMVEMTQDEIIELNEDQFDKLVMDNWTWKKNLISTSAFYGKTL